jgi:hypothetical protein
VIALDGYRPAQTPSIPTSMIGPQIRPIVLNEQHWLSWARDGYVTGKLEIDEFEASVAHILAGGHVDFDGRIANVDDDVLSAGSRSQG